MKKNTKSKFQKKEDDPKKEENKSHKKGLNNFISSENKDWIKKNWKIALLITFSTCLVFFMKIHEESGMYGQTEKHQDNLYEVLGLDASSTLKDIKKQYNKLAIELHPDKHPNCTTCEEKFLKISQAYEILSDEEKKLHYDETEGILETIKSVSKPLYAHNYQKTVLESPYLWIVQIYSEQSGRCQTFSGFWEDFIKDYDYLKFGRIHVVSQKSLLPKLPFAIDGVPFVYAASQRLPSEVLEYSYDESPTTKFQAFVRRSIGVHYYTMGTSVFESLLKKRPTQKSVLMVHSESLPVPFAYFSFIFGQSFTFYVSQTGTYKTFAAQLEKPRCSMLVFHEEDSPLLPVKREFEVGYSKNAVKAVLGYLMFSSMPR